MKFILLIILLPLKYLYLVLNKRKSTYYWSLPIDTYIPLIPFFIIPYLLHHPIIILTGILLWNTQYIIPFLLSLIISYIIAVLFWYFVPNGVHRPLPPAGSIFTPLIKQLYTHDGDTNGFPSAHIFVALLYGHYLTLAFPSFITVIWTTIGLIILSVLFTKQHYIIDIVGGIIVYLISFYLAGIGAAMLVL
jgi:membrane-associated phospholipid phosphatase